MTAALAASQRRASVVPTANRGLKSSMRRDVEEVQDAESALCIDFLTFSGDVVCTLRNLGLRQSECALLETAHETGEGIEQVALVLADAFLGDVGGIQVDRELRGFRNFYAHHVRLLAGDQQVGFIALGGERQRGTFCIELTGAGCAHVKVWAELRAKLESAGCRLTRVDVAFDDFRGTHDLAHCQQLYNEGAFITNGRPPALGYQGWSDDSGRTLYVGKNAGNQQLCVYEKGKQLGDATSPWVRWEARFGAKYRDIPHDILTDPVAYYAGHYPALDFIRAIGRRMVTHVKRTAARLASSMRWAKHQYGGLLTVLFRAFPDRREFGIVCESLVKNKLPKWASETPQAAITRHVAVHLHFAELSGV